jgi:hypothetical protein
MVHPRRRTADPQARDSVAVATESDGIVDTRGTRGASSFGELPPGCSRGIKDSVCVEADAAAARRAAEKSSRPPVVTTRWSSVMALRDPRWIEWIAVPPSPTVLGDGGDSSLIRATDLRTGRPNSEPRRSDSSPSSLELKWPNVDERPPASPQVRKHASSNARTQWSDVTDGVVAPPRAASPRVPGEGSARRMAYRRALRSPNFGSASRRPEPAPPRQLPGRRGGRAHSRRARGRTPAARIPRNPMRATTWSGQPTPHTQRRTSWPDPG